MNITTSHLIASSELERQEFAEGEWNGVIGLPGVFAVQLPFAEHALSLEQVMFNKNAIFLSQANYTEGLQISVVASTRPAERSAFDELKKLLLSIQQEEQQVGHAYRLSVQETEFETTLCMCIKNIAPGGELGPFPLNMGEYYGYDHDSLMSMSMHRIFLLGSNRIEIAVHQTVPPGAVPPAEQELEAMFKNITDYTLTSLYRCTEILLSSSGA